MKVKRTSNIADRIIEKQAYIVNTKTSTLHELDEVGTFIWNLTKKEVELDHIVGKLVETYSVSRDEAYDDTVNFIGKLESKGLVEDAD